MIPLDTTTGTTSSTKWLSGALSIPFGIIIPLRPLIVVLTAFIAVDFITGLIASWNRGEGFCSKKMWRTVYKCVFAFTGVVMMHLLDEVVLLPTRTEPLHLANYFTAFICGTEFWSFLENGSELSNHPVFRVVRKLMNHKFKEATGADIDKAIKDVEQEKKGKDNEQE